MKDSSSPATSSNVSAYRGKTLVAVALGALFVSVAASITWFHALGPSPSVRNVIFISLDTLRRDRLGLSGYHRPTSPFLDQLAQTGAVFSHHVSVSSWTLPSHVSMFTGRYPSSHGVTRSREGRLSTSVPSLPEILNRAGFYTLGITGGGYVGKGFGFERGFDVFWGRREGRGPEPRGFAITASRALELLDERPSEKPFFLFLHTFDIHCPYDNGAPYSGMFRSPDAEPVRTDKCGEFYYEKMTISPAQARYLSDRYDEGIRRVDDLLKDFFAGLKQRGLLDETLVIITSDHGEEFLEHERIGHQGTLYREVVEIPLVIVGPGVVPQVSALPTSLVDLTPTILAALNLPYPPVVEGVDLGPTLRGSSDQQPRPFMWAELDRERQLRSRIEPDRGTHLIRDLRQGSLRLFDWTTDPTEQQNVAEQYPERVKAFASEMETFETWLRSRSVNGESVPELTPEQVKELQSLGYL